VFGAWALIRALRSAHLYRERSPIDEELRGYNAHQPPLKPRALLGLSMSDVVYRVCPTRRDLWLRKRVGAQPQLSDAVARGLEVHTAFHESSKAVARLVLSGWDPWDAYEAAARACARRVSTDVGRRACRAFAFLWSSLAMELGSPIAVTELIVDGTPLGLSRSLRVDALFEGSIVLELKYGPFRREYAVAVAGYAMALESFLGIPIDFGAVICVNGEGSRARIHPVYIDNALRQEFIELRDEAIDTLLSDVEPPRAAACPEACPFKHVCWGGEG